MKLPQRRDEGQIMESFQEIVRYRQREEFVGRGGELAKFKSNLQLSVTDPARRFVFSVHGSGGVGKTFLLRQFRQVAVRLGAACAAADELIVGLPETMDALSRDLQQQGVRLPAFTKLYETYLQRRKEAHSDPNAPEGIADLLAYTTVNIGVQAARAVPGLGIVATGVDVTALARQADRLRVFLSGKFRRQEDVRLLMAPVEMLTSALVRDLARIGAKRSVVLFFDTYEQTGQLLDTWLRAALDGRYGALPADIVVVVAGRTALDQAAWAQFLGVLADTPLAPFTEIEGRQFLASRGLTDERVIAEIMSVTGRLPLLMALLAQRRPTHTEMVGDPSGDAVERFLAWEHDPVRRDLTLAAALPRLVNEDILDTLVQLDGGGVDDRAMLFPWLRSLEFVSHQAGWCRYHEVVRTMMLRQIRGQSPRRWQAIHQALSSHYGAARMTVSSVADWSNLAWQKAKLEEGYHQLCAKEAHALPDCLTVLAEACAHDVAAARKWILMIVQAGRDADLAGVAELGQRLDETLDRINSDPVIACLSVVLAEGNLPDISRAAVLRTRGRVLYLHSRSDEALADLDQAVALAPDDALALANRADVLRYRGRLEDALTDVNRALELDSSSVWAMGVRGKLYRNMGQFERSIADFDRAIEMSPKLAWLRSGRALAFLEARKVREALTDLDYAHALSPADGDTIAIRARAYLAADSHNLALEDLASLDHILELDPRNTELIAQRGYILYLLHRLDEAVSDYNRAIDLDPQLDWVFAQRGDAYMAAGKPEEALADFNRAAELGYKIQGVFSGRGRIYLMAGRYAEAAAEFSRAIEINSTDSWELAGRGESYWRMGRYREALADLDLAIELEPGNAWMFASRAAAHSRMGRYEEALSDLSRAIELDPSGGMYNTRADTLWRMGRFEEALADYDHVIAQEPTNANAFSGRGWTQALMGQYEHALDNINRAVEIIPENAQMISTRADIYRRMGLNEQALADLNRAIELAPENASIATGRGRVHWRMRAYKDALTDFDRALQLKPAVDWYSYCCYLAHACLGHRNNATTHLRTAIRLVMAAIKRTENPSSDLYNLAIYRAAEGDYEESSRTITEAINQAPSVYLRHEAADDLRDLGYAPGMDPSKIASLIDMLTSTR